MSSSCSQPSPTKEESSSIRKSPSIADPVLRKLAEADRSLSGKSRIRRDWFQGTTRITPPDRWQGADRGIS
jgi:hypothetical protein